MRDWECRDFLKWCLPRLGLRWPCFAKVRGTVCKRVGRRMRELGMRDVDAYRAYLEGHESEWARLDAMCRIPVSRFWRDREVFDFLAAEVLPALAAAARSSGQTLVRAWSAGCASGEEPYSLRLAWKLEAEAVREAPGVEVVATEADETMLHRAEAGLYQRSSLRDLPGDLVDRAFRREGELYEIRSELRRDVTFLKQDIRAEMPAGPFDLILCRNLVFTYFDEATQRRLLPRLVDRLRPGAALVIGPKESLPGPEARLVPWNGPAPVYRFRPDV